MTMHASVELRFQALRVVLFSAGLVLTYRYLLDVTLAHDISLTIGSFF